VVTLADERPYRLPEGMEALDHEIQGLFVSSGQEAVHFASPLIDCSERIQNAGSFTGTGILLKRDSTSGCQLGLAFFLRRSDPFCELLWESAGVNVPCK
jgi:hypothetical protein